MSTVGIGGKEGVVGGPLCGTRPNRRVSGGWMFLRESGTARTAPAKGYEPYRWTGDRWVYAGHLWRTCGGCGAHHQVAERCQLCGEPIK